MTAADLKQQIHELKQTAEIHDRRIGDNTHNIRLMMEWRASIERFIEVQKRMIEVGEALVDASRAIYVAARWICQVAMALGVLWAGFKAAVWLSN